MGRTVCMLLAVCAVAMPAAAQSAADLDRAFAALDAYTGGSSGTLDQIRGYVDTATRDYERRRAIEPRLLATLSSRSTSQAAKNFAAEQLYRLCDRETVPALERLLLRSDTSNLARRGLELIKDESAQKALLSAFEEATGTIQMGIAESLGIRSDPSAVRPLMELAIDGNEQATVAALDALARIGGADAAIALNYCRDNLKVRRMRLHARDAYLRCGWQSLNEGDYLSAIDVFDSLYAGLEPIEIRQEALRGLIRAKREDAVPLIVEVLSKEEPALHAIAAEEAAGVVGPKATEAFVRAFPDLTRPNQIVLLEALAKRGDVGAVQTVIQAASSRYDDVRLAGLKALGAFNDPAVVQTLLKAAVTGNAQEQVIARENLERLNHPAINDELVRAAMSVDNAIRSEAVRMMVPRQANNGVPVLLRIAGRDIPEIRIDAMRSLGALATVAEMPDMVRVHNERWDIDTRREMADAIYNVAARAPEDPKRLEAPLKSVRDNAASPEARISLIYVLGKLHDDRALPVLEDVARKGAEPVQDAAFRTLAEWPGVAAAPHLDKAVQGTKNAYHRKTAIAGLARMYADTAWPDARQALRAYERLAKLAATTEERRTIIESVRATGRTDLVAALTAFDSDPALAAEMQALRGGGES
jgi:HEAT repeat protein